MHRHTMSVHVRLSHCEFDYLYDCKMQHNHVYDNQHDVQHRICITLCD